MRFHSMIHTPQSVATFIHQPSCSRRKQKPNTRIVIFSCYLLLYLYIKIIFDTMPWVWYFKCKKVDLYISNAILLAFRYKKKQSLQYVRHDRPHAIIRLSHSSWSSSLLSLRENRAYIFSRSWCTVQHVHVEKTQLNENIAITSLNNSIERYFDILKCRTN